MDMRLVYMGADEKGVVAFLQRHGEIVADFVCHSRVDLAGLKGLV